MVIRQRAIQAEHKQERHDAILDAALRLLTRAPERLANVADVAEEAGLAKGTVYLYFPGKEELLLALHERNMHGFFVALTALVEGPGPVTLDHMINLTHDHLVNPPPLLMLASRCFGMMAQSVPAATANAFRQRMSDRLVRAGAGLERHFPELGPGEGVHLLRHSYALIIGLWQMSEASGTACAAAADAAPPAFARNYEDDLERALRALWSGAIGSTMTHPHIRDGVQR